MSSNILIATPELSDAATVSASTELAAATAANLLLMQPTDLWQSTNLAPYLEIDLGSPVSFNLIAVLFTNMTDTSSWRIRVANSQANLTASPLHDTTMVSFAPWTSATVQTRRHGYKYIDGGWTAQWIRIDLLDASNPDGYIQAGRLYVADGWQPSFDYTEFSVGFIDTSTRERTVAGNTIPNQQGIIPTLDFTLDTDDEVEFYENTLAIQRLRGASQDLLVLVSPEDTALGHDKLHYGLLTPTMRSIRRTRRSFVQNYSLEGLL